jgi:hypothetical protein
LADFTEPKLYVVPDARGLESTGRLARQAEATRALGERIPLDRRPKRSRNPPVRDLEVSSPPENAGCST